MQLLIDAGVTVDCWRLPVERVTDVNAPRIGYDDLIEFHLLLHDEERFAQSLGQLINDY